MPVCLKNVKKMKRNQKQIGNKGFTLMELVMVMLGMGIIGLISINIFVLGIDIYDEVLNRKSVVSDLREAMWRAEREISLQRDKNHLETASGTDIQLITPEPDTIKYDFSLSKIQLTKNNGTARDLIDNLISNQSAFSFQDINGNTLSPLPLSSSLRDDVMLIELQIQTGFRGDTLTLRCRVFPQNLHYGFRMPYHD